MTLTTQFWIALSKIGLDFFFTYVAIFLGLWTALKVRGIGGKL